MIAHHGLTPSHCDTFMPRKENFRRFTFSPSSCGLLLTGILAPDLALTALTYPGKVIVFATNLTCLIQEQGPLGIVPVFWKDEAAESYRLARCYG